MKKFLLLAMMQVSTICLFAQSDTADNYVNRFVTIPSISIITVPDSTYFTNENIKKDTPFILMFFSPDCDHCQKETRELLAYKNELKSIQILMVSPAPYQQIKDFYATYTIAGMPNITMGQDVNAKLGSIYQLKTFPSTFVYDNRGTLAKAFVGNIGVSAIIDAVK